VPLISGLGIDMPTHGFIAAGALSAPANLLASFKAHPELPLAAIRLVPSISGCGLIFCIRSLHCGGACIAAQGASGCDRAVANRGDNGHIVLPVISSQYYFL
jgi:hypothetical protein